MKELTPEQMAKAQAQPNIMAYQTKSFYERAIQQMRDEGFNKRSFDSVRREFHQYTQNYPLPNLAVSSCLHSWERTLTEEKNKNPKASLQHLKNVGRAAYCAVLPKLVNRESIRDFIACVVHGIALEIIPGSDGTRLLYGAQVAQAALPPTRRWRKDPVKTTPETAPKCTQTAPKQPLNSSEPTPNQPHTT